MHSCSPGEQTRCSGTTCGDNGDDRFKGMCDKNGCDIQPHRLGVHNFFGPGSDFQIDSTQPVQVTTQFITDDVCNDWVATTQDGTNFEQKGGLGAIEKAIDAGVVLVMSLWDDHYANVLWLDSTYPVDSTDPGALRGYCSTDSGVPKDVESAQANAHVIFSDIKFGPIGSTTDSPTPGPAPTPTPTPTPTPPAPTPTPSPSPSGCPGGSLDNCIDLCPADVFAACVESCQRRCASEHISV